MTSPHACAASPTLVHYLELEHTQYTYCYSTFSSLHPDAIAYLNDIRGSPDLAHRPSMHQIMIHFTQLSSDLFHALANTDYTLLQTSTERTRADMLSPTVTRPVLGLSFEPIASPKRECVLFDEQLRIVDDWRVKFDALVWLENVATGRDVSAFPQHQQQQRDLQLSRMLHDVNRWLVDWDKQGRGLAAVTKAAHRLESEVEEGVGAERTTVVDPERRWAKRIKRTHDWRTSTVGRAGH
ncbi:hypothetical protein C8Q80DRAFT_1182741 [Daedaleopsis nitida]|nr:hypothetical protein C8Q80DRAFT_1182741 [Daedaleopsis nitida]